MLWKRLVSWGGLIALAVAPAPAAGQAVPRQTEARRIDAFPEPFTQVRGLRELPSGAVLVTDWIEERVVAVDFTSRTATAIGRIGGGPREFRLPAELLSYARDSTLLVDMGNQRLAVIGPDLTIHRTFPASAGPSRYPVTPRGADAVGRLYFGIPPWAQGPSAPPGDSVDIARWDPGNDDVKIVQRIQGAEQPSWQKAGRPRTTPGIPVVGFSPQDGWAVAADGRVAVVRAGDYHVEWLAAGGGTTRGPSYAYPALPVTDADRRAFVIAFQSEEHIAQAVRTNEFAERHPYFRPGGTWMAPDGGLWVERSVPAGGAPVLDVFDDTGRMVGQVMLPAGRRVVGLGRDALYAVTTDADGLETLERYGWQ